LKLSLASLDYSACNPFALFLSHNKISIISSLTDDAWRPLHHFSIRFKYRLIITLISNWQSMRLADALDYCC